jgi:hypothetical protein
MKIITVVKSFIVQAASGAKLKGKIKSGNYIIKLFTSIFTTVRNKLEGLSLPSPIVVCKARSLAFSGSLEW